MNLPEDILMEILSRLPVRSLIRFKCVSKTWNALIDSPRLVHMHLNLQLTKGNEHIHIHRYNIDCTPRVDVVTSFDDLESLSRLTLAPDDVYIPGYQDSYVFYAGDANGIVCMTDHLYKTTLWNPALREFRVIPPRSFYYPDFRSSVLFTGFGFDDATNDYKVVCVEQFVKDNVSPPLPTIIVVQVYNLKTNSWRRLETTCESVTDASMPRLKVPIFFQGKVHWPVWGSAPPEQRFIPTFNITTELFGEVHFPHRCEHYCENYYPLNSYARLYVLDKSTLSLVVLYQRANDDHRWFGRGQAPNVTEQVDGSWQVDVWVMNDYNGKDSWTKQYCAITSIPNCSVLPLSLWKKDKLLLLAWDDESDDDVVICYDLQTGQHHHVRSYNDTAVWSIDVVICVETLVSIK